MKKILLTLALIASIASNVMADDNVSANLMVDKDLTTATLHVNLTNAVEYVAFQMDVTLPDGWTVTGATPVGTSRLNNGGSATIDGESQSTNFQLAYNVLDNNKVRVIGYNYGNVAIAGTSGQEIFSIKLTKSGDAPTEAADWTGTFSDVLFVKSSDLTASTLSGTSADGTLLGDVNRDKDVDTADIVALLDIIFYDPDGSKNKYPEYDYVAADVNNDKSIDTADIVSVLNIIFNIK